VSDVTRILNAIERGDARAVDRLLPAVYQELRQLAAKKLAREKPGQTLQATALVHEAYLRLAGEQGQAWRGRTHFFAAAAEAMRRILIENARRKKGLKHGGGRQRIELDLAAQIDDGISRIDELLALDQAMQKLEAKDKIKAELVKLRFFAGLTIEQAAEVLGISHATAERYWDYARSWLRVEISTGGRASETN